jgi:hypothetical protein
VTTCLNRSGIFTIQVKPGFHPHFHRIFWTCYGVQWFSAIPVAYSAQAIGKTVLCNFLAETGDYAVRRPGLLVPEPELDGA